MRMFRKSASTRPSSRRRASVVVEYILLVTIVGIGSVVGLAVVRNALVNKLVSVSEAIEGQPTENPGG